MTDVALDPQSAFSGTREVDPRHALDEVTLDAWLTENVEGYEGPLTLRQFKGGQSNPTYELATPGKTYVLRRKPPGVLLPSAHAVDREFQVISALHAQGFPVARPHTLCTDDTVIGSMFYVMDKVEGRVFWDLKLPGLEPAERRAIYEAQTDTLAALHRFDPDTIGLSDYGKPGNYFARQVGRWTKQYQASEIDTIEAMDRLIAFLPQSLPADGPTRIVHGDFRLDNMILAPDRAEVRAVLDWELSTLGDPMADFSYLLIAWVIPATLRNGLAGADLEALGIPSVEETVARYAARTGTAAPDNLDWLFAYNLFRLAAICQGIAGRVRDGTAASSHARTMAAQVGPLSDAAWSFAKKAGA
ncbi:MULTISPECIES: phosphotransferase family protein [unclassified Brevundimonas]|jgi:aminoglycoside phosphotransferase (APT) family kinase protein|uniref:phosphotransferase family protein n=1 Tax=unclassified Brevundimonas TaxID=2622653 RepID=UPI000EE5A9EB|nr:MULTISPECIES: phosphotransferase family protein [unclassified Brevundimonas]HAJ04810.1 phosphotransferase family protein [Brevundimonas sp.]|tara:strand:- start:5665 stop:6741 length:1077 start_codon:yes stop_codon:yes gene_type:complete